MTFNMQGVAENALTVLVLGGIGYMIWMKAKGKSSGVGKFFGMGNGNGDFMKYKGGWK